jgi:hypothetical protein
VRTIWQGYLANGIALEPLTDAIVANERELARKLEEDEEESLSRIWRRWKPGGP